MDPIVKLDKTTCRCGIKWGQHPNNWKPEDMKLNCANCDSEIINQDVEEYKQKGNFCARCNTKVNEALISKLNK
jgi:DNA-directed RNA polymerase subunit RPC12/RpoP